MQGLYGSIMFTVSEKDVCTFRDLKESRELVYAEHKALDGLPRLQYGGRNLDTFSFSVVMAHLADVSTVEARLRLLKLTASTGLEMPLVIGLKYHGLYVLKSYEITRKHVHFGVCLFAEVTLSLQEYN